jgi:hypothetical protein
MIEGRKTIAAIIAALVVSTAGYADMTPIPQPDMEPASVPISEQLQFQHLGSESSFISFGIAASDLPSIGLVSEPQVDVKHTYQTQPIQVLTDHHKSITLCLYALLGLGLCKSSTWVRKLSFGIIPEWYHNGGPYQIGHSLAISPDCLCSALVCLIQPDCTAEDLSLQYHIGTIASLLRKSQSTPTSLAARGPPINSQ